MREPILRRESLSRQIIPILREEILTHRQPGQRLEPIEQMAKHFSVSFPTMREALSVLEQEGLVERHVGRGTFVGDLNKSRHVGVLIEQDIADPHAPYFGRRVSQQVVRFLCQASVRARLYVGHRPVADDSPRPLTCADFLEAVERRRLSGVVAFAPDCTLPYWLGAVQAQHIPVVGGSGQYSCAVKHEGRSLRMGVEYLLRRGRRRIALMEYHAPLDHTGALESFHTAMRMAGAEVNPRWIRHSLNPCAPGANLEEFPSIWAASREKPDGLLICDDNLFPATAMAILRLGVRVPQDLLVVTHWNKGSGIAVPFPVAKLEVDTDGCARLMGRTLLKLMRGEAVKRSLAVPCELLEPEAAEPQVYSRRLAGGQEVNVALDGGRSAP